MICVHCMFNDRAEIGENTNGTTQVNPRGEQRQRNRNQKDRSTRPSASQWQPQRHSLSTIPMTTCTGSTRQLRSTVSPRIPHHPTHSGIAETRHSAVSPCPRWSQFSHRLLQFRAVIAVNLEPQKSACHSIHCELTV